MEKTDRTKIAFGCEDIWQMCDGNRDAFRDYLDGDALSLRNLDWLFRHEMARRCLQGALARIDRQANPAAHGCVSKMLELFDLEINVNNEGDADTLQHFMESCQALLSEARADLKKGGESWRISFDPLEIYLADIELGTFGFFPIKYDGGSDDGMASWQR